MYKYRGFTSSRLRIPLISDGMFTKSYRTKSHGAFKPYGQNPMIEKERIIQSSPTMSFTIIQSSPTMSFTVDFI